MTQVASASVLLEPDGTGFGRKVESEIGPSLDRAGREGGRRLSSGFGDAGKRAGSSASASFGSSFLGGLRSLAGPAAAVIGGLGAINFIKDSFGEAREAQKVGALTNQVISSTGGVAKVTAQQVGDLATAISNKTGIDDEAIQSASNLLLTFTNVRNEVGKGNDIFNQATQAATDMGAALGKDPKDSAIQLGKALNDPVKGVTALTKVGVSFTQQQKDQIKTLVASGDTLGAQKIILGELNKEFGGAAAASSTASEKMGVAFGNLKEQIGTALLPLVDNFANVATTKLIPGISGVIDILSKGDFTAAFGEAFDIQEDSPVVRFLFKVRQNAIKLFDTLKLGVPAFFAALSGEGITSDGLVGKFEAVGVVVRAVFEKVKEVGGKAFAFLKQVIPPILESLKGFAAPLGAIVKQLVSAGQDSGVSMLQILGDVLKALPGILNSILPLVENLAKWMGENQEFVAGLVVALTAGITAFKVITGLVRAFTIVQGILNVVMAANPIGLIVIAIAALVAGLIYAYQNSETFRDIVNGVWQKVQEVISFAWNNIIKPVFDALVLGFKAIWEAAQWMWQNVIKPAFEGIAAVGKWMWNTILQPIVQAMLLGFAAVSRTVGDMLVALGNIPGFEWAKTAGEKLQGAADSAENLAGNLKKIPDTVDVDVNLAVNGSVDGVIAGIAARAGRNASGTDNWRGGLTWVGEEGPELIGLPRGTQILSNRKSMSLVGSTAEFNNGSAGSGVEQRFYGDIVTKDYSDFQRKMQEQRQRAPIGRRGGYG